MWKRWKLIRKDKLPIKEYIGQNGIKLKDGTTLHLKGQKYSFLLYENGAVAVQWGYDQRYGPWTAVIDHKDWDVKTDG